MKKSLFTILLTFLVISAYAVILPEGTDARINDIVVNDDNIITSVYLSEPTEINTFLGKIEATGEILFNDNGQVKEFTPNKNGTVETPIGTLNYKALNVIKFFDFGCVASMTLSEVTKLTVNNISYTCYPSFISFYDNWKPFGFKVSQDIPISAKCGDIICAKNSTVMFYENGNIFSLELGAPAELKTTDGNFTALKELILSNEGLPIVANVLKSYGLATSYGKIYPVEGSRITFHENGKVETIIPQDITVIQYEGTTFMTVAKKTLGLDEDGIINEATIKGKKFKIYNWTFEFIEDDFSFVIYPNKQLYINNVILNNINGTSFEYRPHYAEVRRILINKEHCYFWKREMDSESEKSDKYSWSYNYVKYCSIFELDKNSNTQKLIIKIREGTPSHYTEKGKFDYFNSPLIFDENNNLIGYRKASSKLEKWDPVLDRTIDYSNFNRITDEYENYAEDVYLQN